MNSCILPGHVFLNQAQTTGLDLTKGKWILNEIDCPNNFKTELVAISNKEFQLLLNNRLSYAPITRGLLIPKKVAINSSISVLKDLKKGTDSDYFINIKGEVSRNDLEGLNLVSTYDHEKTQKTVTEITLEVYDLNLLQTVYSQKVISTIEIPKNKDDFYLVNKNKNLLASGLKKLIKDIKQKSLSSK